MQMPLPDHDFCRFVDRIIQDTGTLRALIRLAKHHAFSRNLLLFCCWHPRYHTKRFTQRHLKMLIGTIQPWHDRIFLKLASLSENVHYANKISQSFKSECQDMALTSDHIEQLMLAETIFRLERVKRSSQQISTNSLQNIANYCKLLHVRLDDNDCEMISLILTTAYPDLRFNKTFELAKTILLIRPRQKHPDRTQLRLRF